MTIRSSTHGLAAKKRVYKKSSTRAEHARMAVQKMAIAETKNVTLAIKLLRHSFTELELAAMTGLTIVMIKELKKGYGNSLKNPGKFVQNPAFFAFGSTKVAAVCAAFIKALRTSLESAGKRWDGGLEGCAEELCAAIDFANSFSPILQRGEELGGRRFLAVALGWQKGDLSMAVCGRCQSEYLTSREWITHTNCLPTRGGCPICAANKIRRTEAPGSALVELTQSKQNASGTTPAKPSVIFEGG